MGSSRTLLETNELVQKYCMDISQGADECHGCAVPSLSFSDKYGMLDLRHTVYDGQEIVHEIRCWVQRFKVPDTAFLSADCIFVVLRSMSWSDSDEGEESFDSVDSMICDEEDEDDDNDEEYADDENCDEEAVDVFINADLAEDCLKHCCLEHFEPGVSSQMERLHAKNSDTNIQWMTWIEKVPISQ